MVRVMDAAPRLNAKPLVLDAGLGFIMVMGELAQVTEWKKKVR
jgi:hypothetical protein